MMSMSKSCVENKMYFVNKKQQTGVEVPKTEGLMVDFQIMQVSPLSLCPVSDFCTTVQMITFL